MNSKIKRLLSLVLAFVMVFCMFPTNIFATGEETTNTEASTAEGDIQIGYITGNFNNQGYSAISGEAVKVVATESFVVKMYCGDTLVGTATLNDPEKVLLNGESTTISWHASLTDDGDSYWTTTWEGGALKVNAIPNKVELWVDGVKVSEGDVVLNSADDSYPVVAAVVDANGVIEKFVTAATYVNNADYALALQNAVDAAKVGDTIALLRDVDKLPIINKAITIDGQNHTVAGADENQFGTINGTVTLKNLVYSNGTNAIRTDHASYDYSNMTLVVEGCTFNNVTGWAIMGGSITPNSEKTLGGLTVTNCVFNAVVTNENYLVYAQSVNNLTITGCTFNGNGVTKGAIHTGDSQTHATVATISGNTIDGVARGVQVSNRAAGSDITVSGNTFTDITAGSKSGAVYIHSISEVATTKVTISTNSFDSADTVLYNDGKTEAQLTGMLAIDTDNVLNGETITEVTTAGTKVVIKLGTGSEVPPAAGDIQIGYITDNFNKQGYSAISGEAVKVVATKSFVVKMYCGDTLVGTATLNDPKNELLNGESTTISWHASLTDDGDTWWSTEWVDGALKVNAIPNKVELWVDDVKVSKGDVVLNSADDSYPVVAAKVDENGVIEKFITAATYVNSADYAAALNAAFANGGNITLLRDVTLSDTLTIETSINLDGNGHKLTPADASATYNSAIMAGNSGWGDDHGEIITLKGLTFEGWTTNYGVVRAQGVTLVMDGCEFSGCSVSDGAYGVLSLNFTDATVANTKFVGNQSKAIDINYNGDDSNAIVTIDGCTFENNTSSGAGIVVRNDGEKLIVKNSTFKGNTVTTTGNAATLYVGWGEADEVTGCVFDGNTITTSSTTTERFASAIFCDGCTVNGNAFLNNTATRNGENITTDVAVGAYYGAADIGENYWGGHAPVLGEDYTVEFENQEVTVDDYYAKYNAETGECSELTNMGCVAMIGETGYATLAEAIDAAQAGDTVKVLVNTAESLVQVPAGVTLDLNGKVVGADTVLSFGIVKDTAEEVGGIKIDNDTTKAFTKLQPENGGYLPVYDTRDGMYKFFQFTLENLGAKVDMENANTVKFGIRISFTNTDAYEVLSQTDNSCVKLTAKLSWTGVENFDILYTVKDETIKKYATSAQTNPKLAITLSLGGLDNLSDGDTVSAAPMISTVAEVACETAPVTHTVAATAGEAE